MTDGCRVEADSIGEIELNDDLNYGIHTARSLANFPFNAEKMHPYLIQAIVLVKKAAALTHLQNKELASNKAEAIIKACDDILEKFDMRDFPVSRFQGGAGTSTHMNVNEVVANKALQILGLKKGDYEHLHPINDVNLGQSTNDVYPTALRIGLIRLLRETSQLFADLQEALQKKETEFADIIKLGRTQWMDALPIMLGQEFGAYAQAISRDRWRIYKVEERLRQVNIGGTAIGTGLNATRKYCVKMIENLRQISNIGLARAEYPIDVTQNQDIFVEVSGLLKAASVNLFKISNDIRIMASGPRGGIGELILKPLQAGSSIMPAKVNPVLPEMMINIALKIQANDSLISQAASLGTFELNPFLPLAGEALMESLQLLKDGIPVYIKECIEPLQADVEKCRQHLERSSVLVTALVPYIGYDRAAEIGKKAIQSNLTVREILIKDNVLPEEDINRILNPFQLTKPGIAGK